MGAAIRHRGPDAGAVWSDEAVGLVFSHRRLSIIDLSPAGSQPMVSHDGRRIIVFNGEIYNHQSIRRELEAAGIAPEWRGHSDTETLLAAIASWGLQAAITKAIGMFALAVWDRETRSLQLCRDRMGEKPLYCGWLGRTFVFASELKALRQHPDWKGEIDRDALSVMTRFAYVPAPKSIYVGIQKLLPGQIVSIDCQTRKAASTQFWSVVDAIEAGRRHRFEGSPENAVDHLDKLLQDAVGLQMMSDVPLGGFLSGGIDSSVVIAHMQKQSARPVQTFSIGFHEAGYNEADHAAAVASHLRTSHTELYVTAEQAIGVIPSLPQIYDEPFADPSQIPTYLVSSLARTGVTVSLSGDGGDELFSGYDRYRVGRRLWSSLNRVPGPVRGLLAAAIQATPESALTLAAKLPLAALPPRFRPPNAGHKVHRLAEMMGTGDVATMYQSMVSQWSPNMNLVTGATSDFSETDDPARVLGHGNAEEEMMALDMLRYLPDDILAKVDRAAMSVSLETRVPLLDHRMVEFAWSLPHDLKHRDGKSKWILRQVLDRYVPKRLTERPKMGFGVPIDKWLRGPLREWAGALLDPSRLRNEGFFNPEIVGKRWREHLSGTCDWQYPLWNVLMAQAWLEAERNSPGATGEPLEPIDVSARS